MATTPEKTPLVAAQQSPDAGILDTIKEQRGEGGEKKDMSVADIIRKSVMRESPGTDFDKLMRQVATLLKDPKNKLIKIRNTVFLMSLIDPQTVEVHTFSSETPNRLVQNYVGAAKMLKQQGIKKAVTYADQPGYLEVAKKTGLPVKISQTTKVVGGQAKPMYSFELEL